MPPKDPLKRNKKKKKEKSEVASQVDAAKSPPSTIPTCVAGWKHLTNPILSDSPIPQVSFGTDGNRKGLYGVYKRATQRFKEGLVAMVPGHIFAVDGVQALMDAVDFLVEKQKRIDSALLADCRTSLQFRKRHSKTFEGGGDKGHGYFILVLNYCYLSLKKLVTKHSSQQSEDGATDVKDTQFRFTDLHVDSDSDEEETDHSGNNEDATTKRLERPTGPEEEFTIEDLIDSTDRFKACIFLSEVENVMGMVSGTYETTKANMVACKKDATFFMGCLVTTGVVTNFAIHEVMLLEAELKVECPHLDTFYRIIACVFLTDKIDDLSSLIKGYGKSVSRSELIAFIGDAVEQVFRYPSSASHYITPLVELFSKKWRLPLDEVTNLIKVVQLHVCSESFPTFLLDDELVETFKSLGLTLHFWMNDIPNIGGGQSIINTQSLLQMLASRLMTGGVRKLHVPEKFYGDLWDEEKLLARDIRGDMDQLLMADILPELLFSCQYGALSKPKDEYNARFKELLPLFVLLADFVSNPAKPVPLSLTFGIHAILTSIFKLQGNNDVDAIANFSKVRFVNDCLSECFLTSS